MRTDYEVTAWLLAAPDMVAAVAMLPDSELLRASGLLGRNYDENSATGELLGICLVERAGRWGRDVRRAKGTTR